MQKRELLQYKTISVQELRTNMPEISKNLEYGIGYILIRKSKPIAELRPIQKDDMLAREKVLDFFARPPKSMLIHSKKSAVQIIREDRC